MQLYLWKRKNLWPQSYLRMALAQNDYAPLAITAKLPHHFGRYTSSLHNLNLLYVYCRPIFPGCIDLIIRRWHAIALQPSNLSIANAYKTQLKPTAI